METYKLNIEFRFIFQTYRWISSKSRNSKSLYRGAEILILDEPTGVLTPQEVMNFLKFYDHFRKKGKTIVLITHKLNEIMALTSEVSVMRQGEMVGHTKTDH